MNILSGTFTDIEVLDVERHELSEVIEVRDQDVGVDDHEERGKI
jgi:hypothetical protein